MLPYFGRGSRGLGVVSLGIWTSQSAEPAALVIAPQVRATRRQHRCHALTASTLQSRLNLETPPLSSRIPVRRVKLDILPSCETLAMWPVVSS